MVSIHDALANDSVRHLVLLQIHTYICFGSNRFVIVGMFWLLDAVMCFKERYSLVVQVLKLIVNEIDHLVVEGKWLSIDQVLDCVQLVHSGVVRVFMVSVDGVAVGLEQLLIQQVMTSLLDFEVHDSTQDFEKILYDVFRFSAVLTWLRVNHEILPVLPQVVAELHTGVIHSLFVEKVHLLKNVNDTNMVVGQQITFNDLWILFVELFEFDRILIFLRYRWLDHVEFPRWKEPVSIFVHVATSAI
jgi:hypothetical protein